MQAFILYQTSLTIQPFSSDYASNFKISYLHGYSLRCESCITWTIQRLIWTRYVQELHFGDVIDVIDTIQKNKCNNIKQQLGIYLDRKYILGCRGRVENVELTKGARLPVLIPRGDKFTQLLIDRIHRNSLHIGASQTLSLIRQKYWIPQGHSAVRAVLLKCSVCRHYEGDLTKCLLYLLNVLHNPHHFLTVDMTILGYHFSAQGIKTKRYGYVFTHVQLQETFTYS